LTDPKKALARSRTWMVAINQVYY